EGVRDERIISVTGAKIPRRQQPVDQATKNKKELRIHVKEDEWYGPEHVNGVIISAIAIEQDADVETNKEPDHESRIEGEDSVRMKRKMMLIIVKDVRKTTE
ncbi:13611_t:CDS:2, partial [Ambispora gerdemannii]